MGGSGQVLLLRCAENDKVFIVSRHLLYLMENGAPLKHSLNLGLEQVHAFKRCNAVEEKRLTSWLERDLFPAFRPMMWAGATPCLVEA